MKFYLIDIEDEVLWFEHQPDHYIYLSGCGMQIPDPWVGNKYVIIETTEAKCFEDLDWKKTSLFIPSSEESIKTGWLDYDGHLHRCKELKHISYARLILKTSEYNLERLGWIKITDSCGRSNCHRHMSRKQKEFCKDNKIRIYDAFQQKYLT